MKSPTCLSISIVLHHPDFTVLERVLAALNNNLSGENLKTYLIINNPDLALPSFEALQIQFPALNLELIQNTNTGYGAGNNLAITKTTSTYHLVLNPDVFVADNAIHNAIDYMNAHPEVGLLCPAIFGEDGARHYVHRKHPTLFDMFLRGLAPKWLKQLFQRRMVRFELRQLDWEIEQDIPSPSGCFMLFRTAILKQINGFDPKFFLYYEDSDLGRRIWQQGAVVRYVPTIKVTHVWAREAHKSFKMQWQAIKSGLRYFRKWGGIC